MTEDEFRKVAKEKGFADLKTKGYPPHTEEPAHTHDRSVMAMVLRGEFTLEYEDGPVTYAPGESCELPAGTLHAEKTGAGGATLIVGFK